MGPSFSTSRHLFGLCEKQTSCMAIHTEFSERYNSLTGKIPHSMGSLPNLRFLYLESNKFGGEVPSSLKNCKNLTILGLGHNNLSGVIPSWLGQNVKGLKLRFNQFSGNVPTQLCQLHSVMVMDFASNRLSGPIPNCLHNITAMLSSNASTREVGYTTHFAGFSIPITCSITMLIKGNELEIFNLMNIFDLSSNNLSGTVPLEMYMLTGLKSLNLSHNHLMGTIPQEGPNLGSTDLSYIGNLDLCGPPLTKIYPKDEKSDNTKSMVEEDDDDKYEVYSWFYMGLGIGFAVGFLGVLGIIFFNSRCRHAYFCTECITL
ncbi:hypothetical protein GYH30_042621 [Glycine max]|uniref:Uncharacterized protein n=1 Tax=Glycine max TaxID=3847 RepID=A0A0R0G9P0_SOYBN|nr:hypothetical protein GYH30_042621 [Glycine max]